MRNSNFDPKIARVVGFLFMAAGGLMAVLGILWGAHTFWFISHAAKAPGVVIAMDESHDSDHGTMYRPRYTFSDASGIVHTQLCSLSSSDFSFEVGEKVTILYDATSPKHSNIDSFKTVWFGPVFLTGFGFLSGGFASVFVYVWQRVSQTQRNENISRTA
jgi:hypothetical protein